MTESTTTQAIVFTDGACLGNPGPGGYAAVVTIAGEEQIIVGRDPSTTNNKMEMLAAIKALEAIPHSTPSSSTVIASTSSKGLPSGFAAGKQRVGVRLMVSLCLTKTSG
jgi:ribonuclease HI